MTYAVKLIYKSYYPISNKHTGVQRRIVIKRKDKMKTIKNKTFLAVVATILVAGTALFISCSKENLDENIPHQKSDVENLLFSSEYIKGDEKTIMHCIGIDSTTEQFKYSLLSTTIKDGALVDDSKGIWIIDRDNLPFEVGDIVMNESDTGFYIYCQEEEIFIHDVEIFENSLNFTATKQNGEYINCKAYDIDKSLSLCIPDTKSVVAIPAKILRAALAASGVGLGATLAGVIVAGLIDIAIENCNQKREEGKERCKSLGCLWERHGICDVKCTGSSYCDDIANH